LPLTITFARARWSASWGMTALTLLAVVAFIDLGRWQWHRAEQKRALASAFSAGNVEVKALGSRQSAALPRYSQVRVQGRYDSAHQFLLDNMSHAGQPGYEVLTPMRLADGRTLMVNRGWLPLTVSRRQLPAIAIDVSGELTPAGKLDALPVAGIALGHVPPAPGGTWPKLTSFPTMADLSAALAQPLEAQQLLLNADEPLGYTRDWQPSGFGPERHIGYALQWWAFGALALGLYAFLNWHRAPR
jgi:surfeit locus 1 family protein